MTGLVLAAVAVVYGPVLRWAVLEGRRDAGRVAPLPRIPVWAVWARPVDRVMVRRLAATELEGWLASLRGVWDEDLTELAGRLRARTRPPAGVDGRCAA